MVIMSVNQNNLEFAKRKEIYLIALRRVWLFGVHGSVGQTVWENVENEGFESERSFVFQLMEENVRQEKLKKNKYVQRCATAVSEYFLVLYDYF